jgi:hypothetical protein
LRRKNPPHTRHNPHPQRERSQRMAVKMLASTIHISNNNPTPPHRTNQGPTGVAGNRAPPRVKTTREVSEPQQCAPTPTSRPDPSHARAAPTPTKVRYVDGFH